MAGLVKICGLTTARDAVEAARLGADFLGFNFIPKNPRHLTPDAAEEIVTDVKRASDEIGFAAPKFVGVFVDAGERLLAETAPFLSHFQFHGHEDPERLAEIGGEFGVSMIKGVPALRLEDLPLSEEFGEAADFILIDARPQKGAASPAPVGLSFLKHYRAGAPFLVAGELGPQTVAKAVADARQSDRFAGVDASSALELRPGVKDHKKVEAFISAARGAM